MHRGRCGVQDNCKKRCLSLLQPGAIRRGIPEGVGPCMHTRLTGSVRLPVCRAETMKGLGLWRRSLPGLHPPRRILSRHIATSTKHDPSKLRNMALVAHIGIVLLHPVRIRTEILHRLGENHLDGVHPPEILIPCGGGICRHWKHDHRLPTRRTRTRYHDSVRQYTGQMARLDIQPH